MGGLRQWMDRWLGGGPGGAKRGQTIRWLLILGLVGAALMILNNFITVKEVGSAGEVRGSPGNADAVFLNGESKERSSFRDYEEAYANQMKEILSKVVGVGSVEVLVTIDSTEEMTVERNTQESQQVTNEKDQHGATRHMTEVSRSGEVVIYEVSGGGRQPLVTKYIKPKIRGVVVVANGAENLTVKKMISEAVERGLEVPPHRISILPRKQ